MAGMTPSEAESNRQGYIRQAETFDQGFTINGEAEINCGAWGSEATSFTAIADPKPAPLYSTELFSGGATYVLNKDRDSATVKPYDSREFFGRAVERFVLAGYLEPSAKLTSTISDNASGTETLNYTYKPITPGFYNQVFSVVQTLSKAPRIISAVSYYVTPLGQRLIDTKIKVLAYKRIKGVEYPGTVQVTHFAAAKPIETLR